MVSLAYRLTRTFVVVPGIVKPARFGAFRMAAASSLIVRLKSRQESGSPCQTLHVTRYALLCTPLMATDVDAFVYSDLTVFTKRLGRRKAFNTSIRYSWSILSYAFSWSSAIIVLFSSI